MFKRIIISLFIIVGLGLDYSRDSSASTSSTTGFLCNVIYYGPNVTPSMGNYGYLQVQTSATSGVCSTVNTWYACSTGATNSICYANTLYTEVQLNSLYSSVGLGVLENQKVQVYYDSTKASAIEYILFKYI